MVDRRGWHQSRRDVSPPQGRCAQSHRLYQIWINLPAARKRVEPYFSMFWDNQVPKQTHLDAAGKKTKLTVVAGPVGESSPPSPPPDSWASQPENHVAVWTFEMEPGAEWTLPAGMRGSTEPCIW